MVRTSTLMLSLVVLASVLSSAHANWYGKRGDREDFFGLLMQKGLEGAATRDVSAEAALAAIDQIVQTYRRHRTGGPALSKQGA